MTPNASRITPSHNPKTRINQTKNNLQQYININQLTMNRKNNLNEISK